MSVSGVCGISIREGAEVRRLEKAFGVPGIGVPYFRDLYRWKIESGGFVPGGSRAVVKCERIALVSSSTALR
jgi:hypothetical protein